MKRAIYLVVSAAAPATIAVRYLWPSHTLLLFILSCAAMVPLATLLSEATEQLSIHTGATVTLDYDVFVNVPRLDAKDLRKVQLL